MKKAFYWGLSLLLMLFVTSPAFAAELGANAILQVNDSAVLIGHDGQEKVKTGEYAMIVAISAPGTAVDDELFSAFPTATENRDPMGRNCLLLNAKGEALTEPIYQYLICEDDGIHYLKDGYYGVMDLSLKEKIPCEYTNLVSTGEGYLALTGDPYDDKADGLYFIDSEGNENPTGIRVLGGLNVFTDGLMAVLSSDNNRIGYLDARGEWAIQPQFSSGGDFYNGYTWATIESGAGLIDKNGNWLLTPKYRNISTSLEDGGLIIAEQRGVVELIDPETFSVVKSFKGNGLYTNTFYDNGLAVLYDMESDVARLIDETGAVLFSFNSDTSYDAWSDMGDRVIVRRGLPGESGAYLYTRAGDMLFGPVQEIWYLGVLNGENAYAYATYDVETEIEESADWEGVWRIDGSQIIGVIDESGKTIMEPRALRNIEYLSDSALIIETEEVVGICLIGEEDFIVSYPIVQAIEEEYAMDAQGE